MKILSTEKVQNLLQIAVSLMVFEINDISAKIQDGGRNSESSNIFRGFKERILSTQWV